LLRISVSHARKVFSHFQAGRTKQIGKFTSEKEPYNNKSSTGNMIISRRAEDRGFRILVLTILVTDNFVLIQTNICYHQSC